MIKPYIYKITKIDTGQFYIGSQCRGLEIGKNYFTSARSKKNSWLKKDLKENLKNYVIEILKQFENPDECVTEENKLIKENFDNPLILNDKYFNGEHLVSSVKYRTDAERKDYIKRLKEHKKKYDREYREKNIERITIRDKLYRERKETKDSKKEYDKLYRERNIDIIKKKKKEYREKNKEAISKSQKEYREKNKEAFLKARKEKYNNNKEIISLKRKVLKVIKELPNYYNVYSNLEKKDKEKYLLDFSKKYNFSKREKSLSTKERNEILKKIKKNNNELYCNGSLSLKTFIINQYVFNDDNYVLSFEKE